MKYFTQKYHFPLVISEYATPLKDLMQKNGVHKQMQGRWCTRILKGETPRNLYKAFGLNVVQLLGIGQFQSPKRQKMYQGKSVSPYAQKTFPIEQELPIHQLTQEPKETDAVEFNGNTLKYSALSPSEKIKYLKRLEEATHIKVMKQANLKVFPMVEKIGSHGCIMCPYRNQNYWKMLHDTQPVLFNYCKTVQKWGSHRSLIKGGGLYWYGWNKVDIRRKLMMASLKKQKGIKWLPDEAAPTRTSIDRISITKDSINFLNKRGNKIIPALSEMVKPSEVYL